MFVRQFVIHLLIHNNCNVTIRQSFYSNLEACNKIHPKSSLFYVHDRSTHKRLMETSPFLAWTVNFADQKCFFSLSFVEAGHKKSEGRNSVCFFGLEHQRPQRVRRPKFCLFFRTQASTASKEKGESEKKSLFYRFWLGR
jgi:hypothetical protein